MRLKRLTVFLLLFFCASELFAQDGGGNFAALGLGVGFPLAPFKSKTIDATGGGDAKTGFSVRLLGGYQIPDKPYGAALTFGYNLNKFDINGYCASAPTGSNLTPGNTGSYSIMSFMLGPTVGDRADKLTYELALQFGFVMTSFPAYTWSQSLVSSKPYTFNYGVSAASGSSFGFQLAECVRYQINDNIAIMGNLGLLYTKPKYNYTETIVTGSNSAQSSADPISISRYVFILNLSVGAAYCF